MYTYTIKELQNANSEREGIKVQAKSLTAAKRVATREQMYQGTVMVIENKHGRRLALKDVDGWQTF